MRAERLGSYSIAATTAGIPNFVALEIDPRGRPACAPPPMKREVTRPVLLRPPVRFFPSTSDFSGRLLGDVLARHHRLEAPGRGGGSESLDRHGLDLRELGHLLPGLQLHVRLLPIRTVAGERPRRRSLPSKLAVRTSATFTLNSFSTACFTCVLLASQRHFEAQRALVRPSCPRPFR
jgi:hypothetical protein